MLFVALLACIVLLAAAAASLRRERRRSASAARHARDLEQVENGEVKRLAEALRESEQRWRALAETMPQIVFTAGHGGSVDYSNERAAQYTGRSLEELRGEGLFNAIHPDDRAQTIRSWTEAVQNQRTHKVEQRIRREDGTYRWFMVRADAMRDGAEGTIR